MLEGFKIDFFSDFYEVLPVVDILQSRFLLPHLSGHRLWKKVIISSPSLQTSALTSQLATSLLYTASFSPISLTLCCSSSRSRSASALGQRGSG